MLSAQNARDTVTLAMEKSVMAMKTAKVAKTTGDAAVNTITILIKVTRSLYY